MADLRALNPMPHAAAGSATDLADVAQVREGLVPKGRGVAGPRMPAGGGPSRGASRRARGRSEQRRCAAAGQAAGSGGGGWRRRRRPA